VKSKPITARFSTRFRPRIKSFGHRERPVSSTTTSTTPPETSTMMDKEENMMDKKELMMDKEEHMMDKEEYTMDKEEHTMENEEQTMAVTEEAIRAEPIGNMSHSLNMHRENFADFKEGLLDKMKQKAESVESQTEPEVLLKETSSLVQEVPETTLLPNILHLMADPALNVIPDDQGPGIPDDDVELVTIPIKKTNTVKDKKHLRKGGHPGRKIKEISDPAVAKKLSRFSSPPSSSSANAIKKRPHRPNSSGRSRNRIRISLSTTSAPETDVDDTEDVSDEEIIKDSGKTGSRAKLRRPPSLSTVQRHRFRGSEKQSRKTGGGASSKSSRRHRTRSRSRSHGEDNTQKEEKGEEIEEEKIPMRLRPGRVRSRNGVGQTRTINADQTSNAGRSNSDSRAGHSARTVNSRKSGSNGRTGRPQRTRTRNPASIRGRQAIGGRPTSTTTTETTSTTTLTTTTTTTEKVTINPNAHHIVYTLDDEIETEDDLDDVIIELIDDDLEYPDYIVEVPVAEELRSSIPVPNDVFSQATHHLMKNNKKVSALRTRPNFRPTLLPRRPPSLLITGVPSAPVFKATTQEDPGISVTEVIREFVQDTLEKEEKEAMTVTESVTEPVREETTSRVKRGRYILAIGANG